MLRVSFGCVFSFTLSRLSSPICYIPVRFVIKFSVRNLFSVIFLLSAGARAAGVIAIYKLGVPLISSVSKKRFYLKI